MNNSKKRSERSPSNEIVSSEHKIPGAESIMASPSEGTTSSESEPNLKDIYSLLGTIQNTVAMLLTENNKLSTDMAELKSSIAKNNNDVTKMKEEMKKQCKYVASLDKQITSLTKVTKKQKEELEVLQVGLDDLKQYSRKNSFELHGIPEEIRTNSWDKSAVPLKKLLNGPFPEQCEYLALNTIHAKALLTFQDKR